MDKITNRDILKNMKYIISVGFAFTPMAALANPGHSAPVLHTHPWEVVGWVAIGIVASYALSRTFPEYPAPPAGGLPRGMKGYSASLFRVGSIPRGKVRDLFKLATRR